MNSRIRLVEPSIEYEEQVKSFIAECGAADNNEFNGVGGLCEFPVFADWLEYNIKMRTDPPNPLYVRGFTYFAVRECDNTLVGMLNERYALNESLLNYGGHIGYSVRPCERKKGYCTQMLAMSLERYKLLGFDKVLITCNESNIASAKVIENNGGIYENTVLDPSDGKMTKRYWITIK